MPSNAITPTFQTRSARQVRPCIAFDCGRAPLIRVTLDGVISDDAFADYLAESDKIVAGRQRYGLIYDGMRPFELSPRQRRLQADWIRSNNIIIGKLCVGAAFAIDSASARGALTAILWMEKLPFEYIVVKSVHEGQTWVAERLRCLSD